MRTTIAMEDTLMTDTTKLTAAARTLGSTRSPRKAASSRANGARGGRPPATVHVTRVTSLGEVYGHATRHCDPAGCAGLERYFGVLKDAQSGHVYEITAGRIVAEPAR